MPLLSDYPYPRRWSEMSLDFKAMFVSHGAIMVMFLIGGALTVPVELSVEGAMVTAVAILSVANRRANRWRWRGAGVKQYLAAVLSIAAAALVAGVGEVLNWPLNPQLFPWYLGLLNIALFNVLASLRLVRMAQAEFVADCVGGDAAAQNPTAISDEQPKWKKTVIIVHRTFFIAIWLEFMAFFYEFGITFRSGSPSPTVTQTEPLANHSAVVYITAQQKLLVDVLMTIGMVGIPVVILSAFLLQALGIRVLGNVPLRGRGSAPGR